MRLVWLALALWGAVHPMVWFWTWFAENGVSITGMLAAWHASAATSGLVWDLTIAAITLSVWAVWESIRTRNWIGFLAIPACFLIGVSCGLPLYLFLRGQPRKS